MPPRAKSTRRDLHPVAVVGPGWVQVGPDRRAVEVRSAWDALRIADAVPLDHPNSVVQVWILSEADTKLGLEVYPEDPDASPKAQRSSVERQLAAAGEAFLAPALEHGWSVDAKGLGARTTLSRPEDHGRGFRRVMLVLESYQWIFDQRQESVTGEDGTQTGLDLDPVRRAAQIIHRIGTIDQILEVLPLATPAATAHKLLDLQQQKKIAANRRGETAVDASGRNRQRIITTPGVIPKLDGSAGRRATGEIQPRLDWWRQPADWELERAEFVVMLDQRWSYPAITSDLVLGYGEPHWVEAGPAQELAARLADRNDKTRNQIFAQWRCEPTQACVWGDERMFPPHPDLPSTRSSSSSPVWMLPPSMDILLADEDHHGCAASLDHLNVTGAWVWPDCGRMLEPLYKAVKNAWQHLQAMDPEADPGLYAWLLRFVKSVGRAGMGRLASEFGLRDAEKPIEQGGKPWRYQPIMWAAAKAKAPAKLWWQARQLSKKYDIWPIQAATDALIYLVSYDVLTELEAADDGRLGILKVDQVALLMEGDPDADLLREKLRNLDTRRPSSVITWTQTHRESQQDDPDTADSEAEDAA